VQSLPSRWLVTTQWLADSLDRPGLALLDASYYLPTQNRDADAEYRAGHIRGAQRFDIEDIADKSNPLPHMLPSRETFAEKVGALGVSERDLIVVYDGLGLFSAPRAWWMLRLFGAEQVFILDGGLPKWKAEGRPLEAGHANRKPTRFEARAPAHVVATLGDVRAALDGDSAQVIDARAADRFRGEAPEPRPGLRSGHMPGALNVPHASLVQDGRLRPVAELSHAFAAGGVDLHRPAITSCGSGVSAAVLWLALDALGHPPQALYDGSWTEWASQPDAEIATGRTDIRSH
jgi:thiosulfate/3-mercaptopyruvate sulfurtransferase